MTKREKVLIAVTVVATGASICMFAFVSLAHFLKTPSKTPPALITKLYESPVAQLSTLQPVPVTAAIDAADTPTQQSSDTRKQSTDSSTLAKDRTDKYRKKMLKEPYKARQKSDDTTQADVDRAIKQLLEDTGITVDELKKALAYLQ